MTTDYSRTVTTQAELAQAIADGVTFVDIRSERGVWLMVRACGSSTVRACGSSTVRAYGSSTVTAYGSSTVTAYSSSTVTACDSSTVTACDSSTVTAKSRVAVHLHTGCATVAGGVVIDHTQEPADPAAWCAYHDVTVTEDWVDCPDCTTGKITALRASGDYCDTCGGRGDSVKVRIATLYKAVDDAWTTDRGADYTPGTLPICPDWRDDNDCGGGLHFSPSPAESLAYHPDATRFLAVGVAVATLRPILGSTPKAKAPAVVRACVQVDIDGQAL